jgi:hypothetical protein
MAETQLYRVKGELLLIRDPPDEAEAERCLRTAIDIARRQKARFSELRATTSLARLLKRQGKTAEAREMLADLYNWFTDGFVVVTPPASPPTRATRRSASRGTKDEDRLR